MVDVSDVVRSKAVAAGAHRWLEELTPLVTEIEDEWSIAVGRPFDDASEAFVARATLADGKPAVLKLVIPRAGDAARNEIVALRLADGVGSVRLLRADIDRGALLMERLGPSLADIALPVGLRHEILCDAAARFWRAAPRCGLPTGADKGRWLIDHITTTWDQTDRPCSARAVAHAVACAEQRIARHDDERAVLVHGDVHQWNVLQSSRGFKLIDPDGLLAEAEYDLGVIMREDPNEMLDGDPTERCAWLARRTNLDETAIWQWGVIERVSTGLLCTRIGLQPVGREMLEVADRIARGL